MIVKLFTFVLIYLVFLSDAQAQEQEEIRPPISLEMRERIVDEAHVRGFIWGLPPSVIKEQEAGIFVEQADDGTLFFVDTIDDMKSSLTYEFENDKLSRVRIFSERTYNRPQDRINDLAKVKRYLDARFGDPIKEDFEWKSDRDKKFPDQWGWAVYRGELNIAITWGDAETFVTAFLGSKKPFRPALFFIYEDAKARQAKESEALKISPIIRR